LTFPVLIVEDHARTSAVIGTLLQAVGFTATEHVSNADQALARLKHGDMRLVLSDYHMRPMNGLQLLQRLREQEHTADIPFVMVTADKDFALMRTSAQAGIEMLVKPFKADQLRQCLLRAIGRDGFEAAVAGGAARP
tara:strand:- start:2755 stop:3165 length:411 start_codon:yes stop_codon:yes gene_type:complete